MPNPQNMPVIPNFQNIPSFPSNNNLSYIKNEFDNLQTNPMSNFGLSVGLPRPNDFTKWRITLTGASGTPYEKGIFKIMINFPDDFPNSPPIIFFVTPIYHLNINPYSNIRDPLGYVPIDKLNIWKPEYTMKEVLTYLYGLFFYVDPNNGYGDDRINEYRNNKSIYFEKAKFFVNRYANVSNFQLDWGNIDWNFNIYP